MSGAVLLRLVGDADARETGGRFGHPPNQVRLMADHDRDPVRGEAGHRRERIREHGAPAELVQDLGAPRPHAGAEARGEDDGTERAGMHDGGGAYHIPPGFSLRPPAFSRTIGGSSMRVRRLVGAVVAIGMVAGCGMNPLDYFRPVRLGRNASTAMVDDDDHLAWAAKEPWLVVIRKSCRTLDVYRYGERQRSFPAVFGLNTKGSKLYEGDRRTPTGLYAIVDKRPHARWRHFMLLDYPNLQDLHRYWAAMEAGDIPTRGDEYAGVGGAIGIHGTDEPRLNEKNVDWTFGCISLRNPDVDDLASLVPVGTLVWIED